MMPAFSCRLVFLRNTGMSIKWASARESLSSGFGNNKGKDQPRHPLSLINAFVICLLKVSHLNLLQANVQFSS